MVMAESTEEFQVGFSTLTRGELYPIKKIERSETRFGNKLVKGIKVTVLDGSLELVTFLPKKVVANINDDLFSKIASAAGTDAKYTVCYYGMMKRQSICEYFGRVHEPGEARSDKLYDDMGIIMTKYSGESITPEKRKSSDSEVRPSKAMKEDDA
ncbi:Breast cancer type 2 susceptibility protein-like protein [Frankliniella fusca]|uniref:Breast cancer type 2 susceptibility protein-like protein n=1 Tax=Frankliniella fusca TaxID=407009 RepID=A0AAE1GUE7_9NEOP|nr:Breast cancer type 2 susceptibility protein-like protein [Frankliniella fusca]